MQVTEIRHQPNGSRKVIFEHHWREGFLGEALTIRLTSEDLVEWMEFYSAEHGVVQWTAADGLQESHSWEAEETHEIAGKDSHFPVYLLNGVASPVVTERIVESVLGHIALSAWKPELLHGCHQTGSFELPAFGR